MNLFKLPISFFSVFRKNKIFRNRSDEYRLKYFFLCIDLMERPHDILQSNIKTIKLYFIIKKKLQEIYFNLKKHLKSFLIVEKTIVPCTLNNLINQNLKAKDRNEDRMAFIT